MSITCPWDKIFIVNSYEEFDVFEKKVKKSGRKNPRITAFWENYDLQPCVFDLRKNKIFNLEEDESE